MVWRGVVHGLPRPRWNIVATESALSRDYARGGMPLVRAQMPLAACDAWQRPRWSGNGWTIESMPLNVRTGAVRSAEAAPDQSAPVDVMLYPPHRGREAGVPFGFALLAAPEDAFTAAWRALACQEGLPGPHRPSDREKALRIARRPTLFALGVDHRSGERLIEWAAGAGFGSILLHSPLWNSADGHYLPNEVNWPGGWPTLRAFVDRARDRGLAVGLHTLTTSIANWDSYVTPVPHERLLASWTTTLAKVSSASECHHPAGGRAHGDVQPRRLHELRHDRADRRRIDPIRRHFREGPQPRQLRARGLRHDDGAARRGQHRLLFVPALRRIHDGPRVFACGRGGVGHCARVS